MIDRFNAMVRTFEAQIRASNIDGSTEVTLIFHWLDETGKEIQISREEVSTRVTVSGGPLVFNNQFAASLYLGTIIDNMKRLVLDAPKTPTLMRGLSVPVYVENIELEITPA